MSAFSITFFIIIILFWSNLKENSALASLEDRDNLATSPPSNPTSPMLTKSQPAAERQPANPPAKEGEGTS